MKIPKITHSYSAIVCVDSVAYTTNLMHGKVYWKYLHMVHVSTLLIKKSILVLSKKKKKKKRSQFGKSKKKKKSNF